MGVVDLELPERRARVCTGCHYIADARLLSSGHPPGSVTDWIDANRRIQHWKGNQPEPSALAAAYSAAIASRGARPTVRVVSGGEVVGAAPASAPTGASGAGGARAAAVLAGQIQTPAAGRSAVAPGRAPAPRPRGGAPAITAAAPATEVTLVLPPRPEDALDRSLQALLLLVNERLDTMRRQLRGW
jgi:hypothetical protein